MKKITKNFVFIAVALALSGCQTVPQKQHDAIQKIKDQQAVTTDSSLHLDLAVEYLKTADKTQSIDYVYKAIDELEIFSGKEPHHLPAKLMRYKLYYDLASRGEVMMAGRGEVMVSDKLVRLFGELPPEVVRDIDPPSLAMVILKLRIEGYRDEPGLRKLLKKSIKEQPYSVKASAMLAEMYAYDDRYNLALPIMAKITEKQPNDPLAAKVYADILIDSVENKCAYLTSDAYKAALGQLRNAKKLKPEDPEVHASLGRIYGNIGRNNLALNSYRKYDQLQNDADSKADLISAYMDLGKTIEASNLIESQKKLGEVTPYFTRESARFYFSEQDWKRSEKSWNEYFSSTKDYVFYDVLAYSYIDEKLNGKDVALNNFAEKSNAFSDKWHRQLRAYRLGNLSKADLYLKTTNACERTEAHYNIALDLYVRGDKVASKKYLQEVLNEELYGFIEYKAAKRLLRHM